MKDFLYFPSMTKGSLALLYFPGSNPRIATRHLMRWINGCPPLMEELSATGYHTSQKVFTSRQVTLINRHLAAPDSPASSLEQDESHKVPQGVIKRQHAFHSTYLCNVNNEGADTLLTFGLACY